MMDNPFLFILAGPHSYASHVCAMLGQHPQMYGFPGLNLFLAEPVDDLRQCQQRLGKYTADGILRTLAQLQEGEQTRETISLAAQWLEAHGHWSSPQLLNYMLKLSGCVVGIDASLSLVSQVDCLEQIDAHYPNASYLHLTRHPLGVLSALDIKDRFEAAWLEPHNRINAFSKRLAEGQCLQLKIEALLAAPQLYLPQIAEWLGVSGETDALKATCMPQQSDYAALGPDNAPYGYEPKFISNPELPVKLDIDSLSLANMDIELETTLTKQILKLAKEFGYQ
ncbi:MAG: sulfotransferase [Gammaproteobacteria bacterium]|nr:sulfotransferase [Gammaproteobacteria bacterium]